MAEYENPPVQPNYENPLVEQDVYEEATAQPEVTGSLAAHRLVYRNLPGPPQEQCSSYPEPWHSDTNNPRVTYYSSIDNINIYEEIPDIRGSYLSLRDETSPEDSVYDDCDNAANKSSGILHIIKEKWQILLVVIVTLAVGIAMGTVIGLKNDQSTQLSTPSTQVTVTTMHPPEDDQSTQLSTPSTQLTVTTMHPPEVTNTSCAAIHTRLPDAASGLYTIYPGSRALGRSVWCDMDTDGGGWTRVQHRQDGSVAFNRTWAVYRQGFGSPAGEFWLGNDDLHRLTAAQPSELRVDIWDFAGVHGYAKYSSFSVGSQSTNYRLKVSGYSGNAGEVMWYNNNKAFSTTDRDHDGHSSTNCAAEKGGGGWWYGKCTYANLNGRYYAGGVINHRGVIWYYWQFNWYSYKVTSMLTRPRQ